MYVWSGEGSEVRPNIKGVVSETDPVFLPSPGGGSSSKLLVPCQDGREKRKPVL